MCLGLLSHRRGCMNKHMLPAFFLVWYDDVTYDQNLKSPETSYSTMLRSHVYYCYGRLLLRLSDLGVTKDRGAQTETKASVFFFGGGGDHFDLVSALSTNSACAQRPCKVHFYERASRRKKNTTGSEMWSVHKEKHRNHQPSTVGM